MWSTMFNTRDLLNNNAPNARTQLQDHPTLLFSWWCTCFSLVIILLRLAGRYIRTERFFTEDKIMAISIIPLLIRMAFVHVVLVNGTNNVNTSGLSANNIHHREIGSKMVLGARIFYTLFIWTAKFTVSEFLKRLTQRFWKKGYEMTLRGIRIFLFVTFFVVVIATLTECHPFSHFWQVTPDPGPRCRLGYAHLLSMGAADIITDILIVVFPIPIIIKSAMTWKRKFELVSLFSISIVLILMTAARIPSVMQRDGRQQYRTVFASGEILAATAVSNAVVIGSFLRDRGVKKAKKYKYGSTTDSMDRPSIRRPNNIANHHWGSDEDLIRDLGIRLAPELRGEPPLPRPAPAALPASPVPSGMDAAWRFPAKQADSDQEKESGSQSPVRTDPFPSPGDTRTAPARRGVSFFDVGGLLEEGPERQASTISPTTTVEAYDFAGPRRGSLAFLSDIGGLLAPSKVTRSPTTNDGVELPLRGATHEGGAAPTGVAVPALARHDKLQSLQDVGGLLNERIAQQPLQPTSPPPTSEASGVAAASRSAYASRPRRGPAARRDTSPSLRDVGGLLS